MAKQKQKKKNIRLRRQIRKTLGTICLITALVVAAIPVQEVSADASATKYTWDTEIFDKGKSKIPVVPADCDTIYTTGDGTYQFAFVNESDTSSNKIAVILGYNGGTLENNYLEIPNTVEAYTKFSENQGTKTGYVAVSRNQQPLYYKVVTSESVQDASGNDITSEEVEYKPCYYVDYDKWSSLDLSEFYYKNSSGAYVQTISQQDQWIKDLEVKYIGNQSLTANTNAGSADGAVQEWVIKEAQGQINTDPESGIFATESNIRTLVVGDKLVGIGNYAFYGCTNLENIQLGNGLEEVGKYAFANCANMSSVGIDFTSRLTYISDYTFLNCRALTSFQLPSSVTTIYDHAFEGCTRLGTNGGTLDLAGLQANKNVTLEKLGYYVFKGCTGLTEIVLPELIDSADDVVYLNNFESCISLKHIVAQSPDTTFQGDTNFTVDDFKNTVDPTFYFEASGTSATHEFTKENAIAFKYADEDRYEIIIVEKGVSGADEKLTYQVNSNNELLYFNMTGAVEEVEIPAAIGPYGISAINSGSFSDNCFLKKIIIPATVSVINEGAFKGCHNLEDVIFTNAANITYIGTDAFATQVVTLHADACTNKDFLTTNLSPKLTFTGTVGEGIVPFDYAMSASSNINAGAQTKTYITYYSGWPTNLEIQYVVDQETGTGAATLVDYPTYNELTTKYTSDNYPYITDEYEKAAAEAISVYQQWLSDPGTNMTDNQWDIINAALKLNVPQGVKAYKDGLFSGVIAILNDEGVYEVSDVSGGDILGADRYIQEITFADIDTFKPYSFSGCSSLKRINITGGNAVIEDYAFAQEEDETNFSLTTFNMTGEGSSIGDYAFANNQNLSSVQISAAVNTIGLRPFKDCPLLEDVDFSGGPYFTTENAIIYGLSNGVKDTVVQCLESRGALSTPGSVSATELAGITKLAEEAFMDCSEIGSVDLSTSQITTVPTSAFANTESLYSVILPTTCKSISKNAFRDSNVRYVDIPSSVTFIEPYAFNTPENGDADYNKIEFYCEAGSAAETYANEYSNINVTDKPITTTFKVIFWDYDGTILDEQDVLIGNDAVAPADPVREGYIFTGWLPNYTAISKDTDVVAQYVAEDPDANKYTVNFLDYDDTVLKTTLVAPGGDAEPPVDPKREGYTFIGWRPAVTNIQADTNIYAQYEKNDSTLSQLTVRFIDYDDTVLYTQKVNYGEDAITPAAPEREGYTFVGWRPAITAVTKDLDTYAQYEKTGTSSDGSGSDNSDGSGSSSSGSSSTGSSNNGTGSSNTTTKLYTLTVKNGSGSGSYAAGSQPIIIANDPASGMEFSHWTIDPSDVTIASKVLTATVITMPEKNVTITANYKTKTSSSTSGSGSSSNANASSPNSNSGSLSNGTTVVIDKNGLSNTGVVSATVNGSSDNFVIKITESSTASEEIVKALMAEYGDLTNIKYFPMDISLYDSTGTKKITDTTGLSITITLPLPDSMITYAGNNKIAGVVNERLDKLSPKFTTIDGVSCITFTAEHFSPYVIYVDTNNLTAGTIADSTPKTGDGIHPKWFLSIGLACISVVLFMKKDKKIVRKALA